MNPRFYAHDSRGGSSPAVMNAYKSSLMQHLSDDLDHWRIFFFSIFLMLVITTLLLSTLSSGIPFNLCKTYKGWLVDNDCSLPS